MTNHVAAPTVFISYSHADEALKDRLVKHLRPLADERGFAVWHDRQIDAGDDWRARIQQAIATAKVAVLLISADFLGSDFIRHEEVPPLLERRERGLPIVPVIARPCTWKHIEWLSRLQVRPDDGRPLSGGNEHQIDDDLARIATEVDELLRGGRLSAPRVTASGATEDERDRTSPRKDAPATSNRSIHVGRDIAGSVVVQGDRNVVNTGPARPARKRAGTRDPAASPREQAAARERYLAFVADCYRHLDFKGMGVSDRVPLRLPLAELYVPLTARVEMPRDDTWRHDLRVAGRKLQASDDEARRAALSQPLPVDQLLRQHDGLIVLGDPGAGKTTLLKYLALRFAEGTGDELDLGERLPVLIPLSAYAGALAGREVPFADFIADYFNSRGIDLPVGALLRDALERGRALVLLDGLDEVRDIGQRHVAVQRVVDFFRFHRPAGNKFVLTSRIVGYREVRPSAEGLGECTLVDFEQAEIEAFVHRWTTAIERAAHGENIVAVGEAKRERDELLASVQHNPGVCALASNPLLLTILALMKRQGIALPERRVELYQNYVETLLKHWNRARGLDRPPSRDLDVLETLRVLAPLALSMHETSPGIGLVNRDDVCATLEDIYRQGGVGDPEVAARRLLEDLRTHAGLLLERGPGQYGFIHLTFQEYLAGMALAQQAQEGVDEAVQALARHVGDPTWREASLLCIGYLGIVQRREKAASAVVERLLRDRPGAPGEAVVLCGDAVADAWPGGVTLACRDAVRAALLATMRDDAVAAPRRAAAGATLARLGDPRFRADAWYLPDEPLLGFVEIPAGPFRMGSDKQRDPDAFDDEQPEHEVTLPRYFIARFPVTIGQLRAFVDDGGRIENQPALRGPDTAPTRWVRFREALAYTAWLTNKLRAWNGTPEPLASLLRDGAQRNPWRVTLPSEAEWEKAARGKDGRMYPWGDARLDSSRANYHETGIGRPCAVGCFLLGASPYGVEDLCGNVWEWTRSVGRPYPYDPADGREALSARVGERRVVRGAAVEMESWFVRPACRITKPFDGYHGFRVVVSPSTSEL